MLAVDFGVGEKVLGGMKGFAEYAVKFKVNREELA
jgi:hypothetical protein